MKKGLKQEEKIVCRLLAEALHWEMKPCQAENEYIEPELWAKTMKIAENHRILPLLYDVVKQKNLLRGAAWESFERECRKTVQQSYRLLFLSRFLTEYMEEQGIPVILLKGCTAAEYYPVPELRKSGDIDLLMRNEKEARQACDALAQKGFVQEKSLANHHINCVSPDGICVELHTMLAEPFDNSEVNSCLDSLIPSCFEKKEEREAMGIMFPTLSPPYQAFYLLLHMLQHFLRAGFGLKLLCDWVVFWERKMSEQGKRELLFMLKESGIYGFAQMITAVCVQYLGMSAENTDFLMEGAKLTERITEPFMREILEAEEFGKSSKDRMVIPRGSSPGAFLREFHHQTMLTYPKEKKYVILWPVLWVKMLFGFWYRNRKIRRVSGISILKKAGERGVLVKHLHLFEK